MNRTLSRKSARKHRQSRSTRAQLHVETLEQRNLLATITWDGGAGTPNWGDAANWDTNNVPGGSDVARFASLASGNVTVDLGAQTRNVQGVVFDNNSNLLGTENFDTNGAGTRYTITKGGNNGNDQFWQHNFDPGRNTALNFTNVQGPGYFTGAFLNQGFAGGASDVDPRRVTLNPINVTGQTNVQLTVALASTTGVFEATPDYLRIEYDPDGAGPAGFTQLTQFAGTGGSALTNGTTTLGLSFQDVSFAIPDGATDLVIRFSGIDTAADEIMAFDNVRITGGPAAAVYTLNNGTIGASGGTLPITQNGTSSNVINALIAGAAPVTTVTANAGRLTLGNALNPLDTADSITVASGATVNFAVGTGGARAIGTAAVNLNGGTLGMIAGVGGAAPGLLEGYIAGGYDITSPNPGTPGPFGGSTGGAKLGPLAGNSQADAAPYWNGDNINWVYTGQFFDADGIVSFAENIDDETFLKIDGVVRINDAAWNNPVSTGVLNLGMGPAGDGWHDIDIRFHEGGGGAGPSAQNNGGWINWTNTKGFGLNTAGTTSTDANDYPAPVDPGDASLFRGPPVATVGTNVVNVTGASTINTGGFTSVSFGALNMAANAALTVATPGTLTFTGTATLAGGNTISNTGIVALSGQVTGASLTKAGTGTLILSNATNNYTGTTTVNGGILQVTANGALGTTAGGTVVNNGGQLSLRSNYTNTEALTLNGQGPNNTGALESNGNFTYAGPITLGSAARITSTGNALTLSNATGIDIASGLTVDGSGTTAIQSPLTGAGTLTKVGTGTLILSNSNSYTGATSVNSGTLRITNSGALGTTAAGTTVASGATLELNGSITLAGEALTISGSGAGGAGAINNVGGNGQVTSAITMTGAGTTINSATAGSTLTIAGTISMPAVHALTFTGAGNVTVQSAFGNGGAPIVTDGLDGRLLNNQTGIGLTTTAGIADALGRTPTTRVPLTGALNFPQDADTAFTNFFGGGLPGGNNFTAIYTGQFTVTTAGDHAFAVTQNDDTAVFWLDRDGDRVFETAGDAGNELIRSVGCCNDTNSSTIPLTPGVYDIAFAVEDTGGGSGLVGRFQDPPAPFPGALSLPIVNPSVQPGRWTITVTPNNSVTKNGTGTVTLLGANTYNGVTTINAGTLAAGHNQALGVTAGNTVVVSGATLQVQGGVTIAEPLVLNGLGATGQPGALANLSGNNTVSGPITAAQVNLGEIRIGSTAGTLTIGSNIDLQASRLSVNGDGNVVVNGNIGGAGGPIAANAIQERIFDGIPANAQDNIEGYRAAAIGAADASGFLTTQINYPNDAAVTARAVALGAVGFDEGNFSMSWVTTFTPNETGAWGFRFAGSDDDTSMWVDVNQNGIFEVGSDRFFNSGCCPASGDRFTPNLTAGQKYLLGFALSDGGGGGNLTNMEFRSPTAAGVTGGNWAPLSAAGFPGTFTTVFQSDNRLTKLGNGTLTINGTATLVGPTTVSGGTLNGNGTVFGPINVGSTAAVSGGGTGAVGTFTIDTTSYRYYRFFPTAFRNPATGEEQLSEMQVLRNGVRIPAVAVTNPGGNFPGGESPPNANDNLVTTKWLDFNKGPLVLDMGSPIMSTSIAGPPPTTPTGAIPSDGASKGATMRPRHGRSSTTARRPISRSPSRAKRIYPTSTCRPAG